jgi:hypothetical protein
VRVIEQAFAVKSQQQFPADNVLESAAGLNPVPMFAQFPGNMGPALFAMFTDRRLDDERVIRGNFAVSDD